MMEESAELRDDHYEIALPWRVFPPDLLNNKLVAEYRLSLLKKRLIKDPDLHQKYVSFEDELFKKRYAQKVPDDRCDGFSICTYSTTQWFIHQSLAIPEWYLTVLQDFRISH